MKQPAHLAGRPSLEVAAGVTQVRAYRDIAWHRVPAAATDAWERFTAANGVEWKAYFDTATGVPGRIYGKGIPAPGSVASPASAEQAARAFLANHLDLIAPGASASDFLLVANVESRGMRSVGFHQYARGMRVLTGQVSFRFKNDRLFVIGSEALPAVLARKVGKPAMPIGAAAARTAATAWLAREAQGAVTPSTVSGPHILPLVSGPGAIDYRTVMLVVVDTKAPIGRWDVFVDAATGAEIAKRQTLHFATGTINVNTPVRQPEGTRMDYPARDMNVTADGAATQADTAGAVTWTGSAAATVNTTVNGDHVYINNEAGAEVTGSFTVAPGASVTWDLNATELSDAQLTTYIHYAIAIARGKFISPEMTWLDGQLVGNVNVNDTCNAFSDGDTINMFREGGGCNNTGRLPDVVYHEFGHSYHAHAIIPGVGDWGDGSLGEGIGDYLSATITNDCSMGLGFFMSTAPLRECDPQDGGPHWPEDVSEIHETGIIYAATMWDFRLAMIAQMGEADGVAYADRIFFETIQRAVDIPSTYVEALAADDDNGDLTDGTPNECAINDAWAQHGLAEAGTGVGVGIGRPVLTGLSVAVPVTGMPSPMCPNKDIDTVTLNWGLRGNDAVGGSIPMTEGASEWTGTIPAQPDGSVVNYQVVATFLDGTSRTYPDNLADPEYELFIGEIVEIFCTDFESGEPAGWTHGLTAGAAGEGADDWMYGPPMGMGGDPAMAYSGSGVVGNDLGGGNFNGQYQDDKVNFLQTHEINVAGYANVRLQYRRWLNMEDGQYDLGTIYANGQQAWSNLATSGTSSINHTDKEWRFHDVDITQYLSGGLVTIKYEMASDGGVHLGGWTIDDFCVVAYIAAVCGDGNVTGGEQCDDGNSSSGDGCSSTCLNEATGGDGGPGGGDGGPGEMGDNSGCGCRTGGSGTGAGLGGLLFGTLLAFGFAIRRRR